MLFILRVSSLLSSLNDAPVDIVDDEGSFEFSPKAEFTSPLHVQFHFTLAIGTETESPIFAQLLKHQKHFQTFSNQMALKPVTA